MLVLKLFTLLFTIDTEKINSLHVKRWSWSWGLKRGSTVNFHMENSKDLTYVGIKLTFFLHVGIKTVYITVYNWHWEDQQSACEKVIASDAWKGDQPLHMKRWLHLLILGIDWCREDQQSTFTWKIQKI